MPTRSSPRFFMILRAGSLLLALMLASACAPTSPADNITLPTRAVFPTDTPIPFLEALPFWETVSAELTQADERHRWQFEAASGDAIRLRLRSDSGVIVMRLQNANGEPVAAGNDFETTLTRDGRYDVIVETAGPQTGAYDLRLSYTDRPQPLTPNAEVTQVVGVPTPTPPYNDLGAFVSRLQPGETISGVLSATTNAHIYTFDGAANQIIGAEMRGTSGTLDPRLTLYDSAGRPLALDESSGGFRVARLYNIRLPEDGLYSLQASGDGESGNYAIALRDTPFPTPDAPLLAPTATLTPVYGPPTIGPAANDQRLEALRPVRGALDSPSDFSRFSLQASRGDRLTIGVSPVDNSTLQPKVEVFGPEGNLIISARGVTSGDDGRAFAPLVTIPASGVYTVIVTGENDSFGDYTLSYGLGPVLVERYRGDPAPNSPVMGSIERLGQRDLWRASFVAGDVLSLGASPDAGSNLDPVLEVVNEAGEVIATDDNSGGNRAALINRLTVPATGQYRLRVRDALAQNTGAYSLVWRLVSRPPTATPEPRAIPLLTVTDGVPQDRYAFYTFQGRAGQGVRVRVDAAPDSGFDPVAAVLDAAGTIIAEGDDANGTLNPDFTLTLPEDGTYSVRVNGYLSGGAFTLRVAWLPD